jgi:uncharacterized membrane protein YqhA
MTLSNRIAPFILILIVAAVAVWLPWWALTILSFSVLYRPFERLPVFLVTVMGGLVLAYVVREVQNHGAGSRVWSQLLQLDKAPGLGGSSMIATMITTVTVILIATAVFTLMIGLGAYVILRLKEIKILYRQ